MLNNCSTIVQHLLARAGSTHASPCRAHNRQHTPIALEPARVEHVLAIAGPMFAGRVDTTIADTCRESTCLQLPAECLPGTCPVHNGHTRVEQLWAMVRGAIAHKV
jgi:hypothetical protein